MIFTRASLGSSSGFAGRMKYDHDPMPAGAAAGRRRQEIREGKISKIG
jgi:hypothetical protein